MLLMRQREPRPHTQCCQQIARIGRWPGDTLPRAAADRSHVAAWTVWLRQDKKAMKLARNSNSP